MSAPPRMKRCWPELVGKTFAEAEATIMKDRPDVHIVHVLPGTPMPRDLDRLRVFVITEGDGDFKVTSQPGCG